MALREVWVLVFDWSVVFALIVFDLEKREVPCVHSSRYVSWVWPLRALLAVSLFVVLWAAPHVKWLWSFVGGVPVDLAGVYGVQLGIDAVGALVFHWKGRHDFECLFALNFPLLVPYVLVPLYAIYNLFLQRKGSGFAGEELGDPCRSWQRSHVSLDGGDPLVARIETEKPSVQSASLGPVPSEVASERFGRLVEGCGPAACVRPSRGSEGSNSGELALSKRMVQEILLRMRPWMRKVLLDLDVCCVSRRRELRLTHGQTRKLVSMGLIRHMKEEDTVTITAIGEMAVRFMDSQAREIVSQAGRGGGGWARGSPRPFQKGPRPTGSGAASPKPLASESMLPGDMKAGMEGA